MDDAEYRGILDRDGGKGWALSEGERAAYVATQPRRQGQMHVEAKNFFDDATLEGHHIVEKSLIRVFNKLAGDLTIANAPCVAACKEIHSRDYTSKIAAVRDNVVTVEQARACP